MNDDPKVVMWSESGCKVFRKPVDILTAVSVEEVLPALSLVEEKVAKGLYAAGFIAYEAGPALDKALVTASLTNLPLLWFGLFEENFFNQIC